MGAVGKIKVEWAGWRVIGRGCKTETAIIIHNKFKYWSFMDVLPYTVPVGSDEAVVTGVVFGTEKNKTQTHMSQ